MDPKAIINSYVGDVIRHLPRRQRNDIALELQSLLQEELAEGAASAGRPADAPMTMELLSAFGVPRDVADRYRPAGFTIIRASDAPRFTWIALGGIFLIWAITLPAALLGVTPIVGWDYGADTWWGRLTVWWFGAGLGALWWPGAVFVYALIGALAGRRRESGEIPWKPTPPRAIDRDLISRPIGALYVALGLLGVSVLVALPSLEALAPGLPRPVLDALALDPEFLSGRAPWILLLWAAILAVYVSVLLTGRWSLIALRIRGLLGMLTLGIMLWWVAGGPVFVSAEADTTAKALLIAIGAYAAFDAALALRRGWTRATSVTPLKRSAASPKSRS